jgi:hypothetical protein
MPTPEEVYAKLKNDPTAITTEDIRALGEPRVLTQENWVEMLQGGPRASELRHESSKFKEILDTLTQSGHTFGYSSDDDPLNDDPDNLLNVLLTNNIKAGTTTYYWFGEALREGTFKSPWQVIVQIIKAFASGENANRGPYAFHPFLGYAISNHKNNMLKELIEHLYTTLGAERFHYMGRFHDLFFSALESRNYEAADYLVKKGIYVSPQVLKQAKDDLKMMGILLQKPLFAKNAKNTRRNVLSLYKKPNAPGPLHPRFDPMNNWGGQGLLAPQPAYSGPSAPMSRSEWRESVDPKHLNVAAGTKAIVNIVGKNASTRRAAALAAFNRQNPHFRPTGANGSEGGRRKSKRKTMKRRRQRAW